MVAPEQSTVADFPVVDLVAPHFPDPQDSNGQQPYKHIYQKGSGKIDRDH
jgi:hypothetical protein